ncbi:hypothetical protein [Nocardia altamirensis]|uniref:hypothetical protein n=1 Tax=Nocardia altamirensis TaxID=472158 RepID=UPI001435521A|nr:hypothetical protein [Nocardia altamirensis]
MSNNDGTPEVSRRAMLRGIGASGAVALAGAVVLGGTGTAQAAQDGWLWCNLCSGLWYGRHDTYGTCPGNSLGHRGVHSGIYTLKYSSDGGGGQDDWRWCRTCEGLWYNGHPSNGVCPAGGAHTPWGSGNYLLSYSPNGGGQDNWRWCLQCEGLWHAGGAGTNRCPAGGGHTYSGSGNYIIPKN